MESCMEWLGHLFEKYPEMAVYLAIGVGYLIGGLKFRGAGIGAVTGSLLAGILVGNFFHVPVSDAAKSILFLLFLFGIGYSVGPSFFRSMKGSGWRWAVLGVFMPLVGLITAYAVARFLKLDLGFAAGLFSGALTESPAIGTASEAIRALAMPDQQKQDLISHIAVADAVCYIFGTAGLIWFCSSLGPKLLGINLKEESKKIESDLGIKRTKLGVSPAWQPIAVRAYTIPVGAAIVGKTVDQAQRGVTGARIFAERIRRNGEVFQPVPATVLEAGDSVALLGRTEILVSLVGPAASEVADPELLNIPVASYDIYVTGKLLTGKTLQEIVRIDEIRGIFLRGIIRNSESIPVGIKTVVERGDILQVTGPEAVVENFAQLAGRVLSPVQESDLATLGIAIFCGVLAGALITIPIGHLRINLGTSVGTLLAGLLVGWFRSLVPWFGGIPDGAILFMRSMGLAGFVAMIGLKAGPVFVSALKDVGYVLLLGGVVVTLVPLLSGLLMGRYVLKLNPVLLLGGLAGAQTMTAGLAAVQEKADSTVAVLGYSGTIAFGHILLTTCGTLLIALLS
jgi:putative transport protein